MLMVAALKDVIMAVVVKDATMGVVILRNGRMVVVSHHMEVGISLFLSAVERLCRYLPSVSIRPIGRMGAVFGEIR